ncbi:hypothetical protein PO909_031094 [Leuciscus waleckii]
MTWLHFTYTLTVPVTNTLVFIGTNIKPVDSQFTCSINSQLDQAAVKKNLRKDFMQISNPQANVWIWRSPLLKCQTLLCITVLWCPQSQETQEHCTKTFPYLIVKEERYTKTKTKRAVINTVHKVEYVNNLINM